MNQNKKYPIIYVILFVERSMKENDGEKSGALTHDDTVSKVVEITRTKNSGKRGKLQILI